jgi:hypothetical protein
MEGFLIPARHYHHRKPNLKEALLEVNDVQNIVSELAYVSEKHPPQSFGHNP